MNGQPTESAKRDPFRQSPRVAGAKKDVWSVVNEAAAKSPKQPVVNMGQGFFGYNPPQFVLDAHKEALDSVAANQYSLPRGRPRLRKAIADAHKESFGYDINPETEVTITTGANEGMLAAFMGFLDHGDEVIVFEPFFDQYISNIEMGNGKVVYVPMYPPKEGNFKKTSASEWTFDVKELEAAITPRTRMVVVNSPHNPVGKVFTRQELLDIGNMCVKHGLIIVSDEVYDKLYYSDFTRMFTLSPEIARHTLTVGSGGKNFYCTGWRVGWLIGYPYLVEPVMKAHTRICFCSPSPPQEALATALEKADEHDFWNQSREEMLSKVKRFVSIFDELGLPYSMPEGGYFIMANFAKVKIPDDYTFPDDLWDRPRDYRLAWFLIMELGVVTICPSEFMTPAKKHTVEDWLRFAICKDDQILDDAKERLRGLKKYMT